MAVRDLRIAPSTTVFNVILSRLEISLLLCRMATKESNSSSSYLTSFVGAAGRLPPCREIFPASCAEGGLEGPDLQAAFFRRMTRGSFSRGAARRPFGYSRR